MDGSEAAGAYTVFDRGVYTAIENNVQPEAIGRDFTEWFPAYDGSLLDKGEMNEWLDDTIETILACNSGHPLNVLELGRGSEMVLFNITKKLTSYLRLELSQTAVEFVARTAGSIPDLANKVQVYQGTGTDLHALGSASPNLVVINSVAQYLPSRNNLFEIVEGLLNLDSVQTIFFGDVRSYALQRDFMVRKVLRKERKEVSRATVRDAMTELAQAELELLVDPAFFTSRPNHFSNRIEHVEVLPKKMKANNAAIIHLRNPDQSGGVQQQEMNEVRDEEWINFMDHKMGSESLLRRLEISHPVTVAVSNIPFSKTILERHVIDALDNGAWDDGTDWLSSVHQRKQNCRSLSAVDLVSLAQQAGYQAATSWARQHSQRGGLDAIFHSLPPSSGSSRVIFRLPTDHQGRKPSTFSNQPLQQQARQTIQQQLYGTLQAQIPSYMLPEDTVILEKFPMNADGVNRKALARLG
ncbi:MAG: putative secondary metabolism biosynthetic enzyme [Ramalina farinacea]|uniref:Secondary metabolism biosynthetic enzyme n=1 Tax=Ramalina farinacea TaxID=258253 RepID=A0AA43TYZ0_9LECA|nr:putative secondary metabolism biosynthetic enzyme [Ramalina farinacea]